MTEVVPAEHSDREGVRALLLEAGLPLDGLLEVPTTVFVARDHGRVMGAVALERHGEDGLLRSLVVDPGRRGERLGSALADAAEREASRLGLGAVYLLTETAALFFAARGFEMVDRADAPAAIVGSIEWSVACAETAEAMVKHVARSPLSVPGAATPP